MYVHDDANERRTQAARTATTRKSLIDAARTLFAARGYAETSTEEIVRRAHVTRGALYHHFTDKQDLFRAVIEEIERDIDEAVHTAAHGATNAAEAFVAGSGAFLDACLLPDVKQILLLDGPAVLGWQEWHSIEVRHALAQVEQGLQALMASGYLAPQPVAPLAHLVHGALIEAGLVIAAARDPVTARAELGASLNRLLGLPRGAAPSVRHAADNGLGSSSTASSG